MKLEVFGTMEVPCKHLKSAPVLAVSPSFRIVAEYFFSWPMLLCNGCAEHRRGTFQYFPTPLTLHTNHVAHNIQLARQIQRIQVFDARVLV